MTDQIRRDHHTVSKLYLQGFCEKRGLNRNILLARHRDGHEEQLTIKEATVVRDFYDAGGRGQPDDALEKWFAETIESPVGEIMKRLRKGVMPSSSEERAKIAAYVATQLVRTVALRAKMEGLDSHIGPIIFANMALQHAIQADPAIKAQSDLKALYHHIARCAPEAVRKTDTRSMLRTMVREADRIMRLLLSMEWMLTSSSTPLLVTGDAPVVTVSGTGELDVSTPVVLPDLHEVHLPITPSRLLTFTPFPQLTPVVTELTAPQAILVNQAIIRNCWDVVLRHPKMAWPTNLTLPPQRASIRTPTVKIRASTEETQRSLRFPSVVDVGMKQALALLGGDPDLSA